MTGEVPGDCVVDYLSRGRIIVDVQVTCHRGVWNLNRRGVVVYSKVAGDVIPGAEGAERV